MTLRDGDIFSARNKLGATNYYCVEGSTAKRCNVYITLRAVGETLDRLRAEVERHNKTNPRFPLAPDALDTMEVEIAWFIERTISRIKGAAV